MKTINETFTDEEYEGLVNNKGDLSWHDYILQLIDRGDKYDKENNQRRGIQKDD